MGLFMDICVKKRITDEAVFVICGDKDNQRKNTPARGVFYSHADLADFRRKANRSTLAPSGRHIQAIAMYEYSAKVCLVCGRIKIILRERPRYAP